MSVSKTTIAWSFGTFAVCSSTERWRLGKFCVVEFPTRVEKHPDSFIQPYRPNQVGAMSRTIHPSLNDLFGDRIHAQELNLFSSSVWMFDKGGSSMSHKQIFGAQCI